MHLRIKKAYSISCLCSRISFHINKPKIFGHEEKRTITLSWRKGGMRTPIASEHNDLVALLQIEAEYFAGNADYVRRQDNEKLSWLIIALRFESESYSLWLL